LIEKLLAALIIQQPSVFVNIYLTNSRFDAHNCASSHKLAIWAAILSAWPDVLWSTDRMEMLAFTEKSPRLKSQGPEMSFMKFVEGLRISLLAFSA
jgi:hypothetical protein